MSDKILAAKSPVQAWFNHRDTLLKALADHDEAGTPVIQALLDTAGANGPFRFSQGLFTFRKAKGSETLKPFAYADRTEL